MLLHTLSIYSIVVPPSCELDDGILLTMTKMGALLHSLNAHEYTVTIDYV